MLQRILIFAAVFVCFSFPASAQGNTATPGITSKPAQASKKSAIFRPTKDQIMKVQRILKDKKLYNGEVGGKYNDETRAGIKNFQKDNGLKQTGTLNRATLEKFGVELTDSQKLIPVSPTSYATSNTNGTKSSTSKNGSPKKTIFRANSDQIKAAQKLLKSKSMYAGEETGKLDDATRAGLRKYQEAAGLKVTGTLNPATLEKMSIALTDKQKASVVASATPPSN